MEYYGKPVAGYLPALRQLAFKVKVFVITDKPVIDKAAYLRRRVIRGKYRYQRTRVTDRSGNNGVAVIGGLKNRAPGT
jgi:hypothetical protein